MSWHPKILGHEKQKLALENYSNLGNLPNAFLFVGPKNTGKFRLAREFAKLLNEDDPQVAEEIRKNTCPDVMTIGDLWQAGKNENWEKISKTSNFDQQHRTEGTGKKNDIIGVGDIHKFLEPLQNFGEAKWKVGIIRDAQRLGIEAANSLLKTLEEPPMNTIFILTTTHEKSIPETIVSRCQILNFSLIPQKLLTNYLTEKEIDEKIQKEMLTVAQGRSEYLFELIKNSEFFEQEREEFQEIAHLFGEKNIARKIKAAEGIVTNEENIPQFLENFERFLRSLLIEKAESKHLEISDHITHEKILELFDVLKEVLFALKANANKKLAIERLLLAI